MRHLQNAGWEVHMSKSSKANPMKLGLFVRPVGHHVASWRHPDSHADAGVNFQRFVEMAQTAERGRFDMLFSADTQSAWTTQSRRPAPHALRRLDRAFHFDGALWPALPATLGWSVPRAPLTKNRLRWRASLPRLISSAQGRAGWNLITSGNETEAQNFGRVSPSAQSRTLSPRAASSRKSSIGLWQSWDDDAFVRDRDSGVFFDREKMHVLDHHGKYFDVRGPLNVPRSPQGQPVLVQAGASDDGIELAAETAEVVFAAQNRIEGGKAFYAELKGRMAKYGRNPDHLKILPGLAVTVGRSADEAKEKYQRMQDLIHPDVGLGLLSRRISFDLSGYPLDGPLPELPRNDVASSRSDVMAEMAKRENLTIRQLYQRFAGARGHLELVGTPVEIVDTMQQWVEERAADGFNAIVPVSSQAA